MDSLEEANARVKVRSLVSTFLDRNLSDVSADIGAKSRTTPGSTSSACASETSSKDIPLHFKKTHVRTAGSPDSDSETEISSEDIPHGTTPGSTSSICASETSSKDIPLHFKKTHVGTAGSPYSNCETEKSSKDILFHLRKKHGTTPGSTSSTCASETSSKDIPLHFKKTKGRKPVYSYSDCETSSKDIPLHFRKQHGTTPGSTSSTCASEMSSKDIPLYFKKTQVRKPVYSYSDCETETSSKDIPLHFRKQHGTTPGSTSSTCASEMSSKDIPLHFKKTQGRKPVYSYSDCETETSSKDIPLHFRKQHGTTPGSTSSTCAFETSSKDIPLHFKKTQLEVQCPPSAVYPVQRTDHITADHFIQSRMKLTPHASSGYLTDIAGNSMVFVYNLKQGQKAKVNSERSSLESQITNQWMKFPSHPNWDHQRTETKFSSDTSDNSSVTTSGSKNSQYDEETVIYADTEKKVMCDICHRATAVKTCLTCSISFCEYHARQHYQVEALHRHMLTDVCEEVEGKRCHHYENSLDFLCRTDQMQICSICVKENHRGHDIVSQRVHRIPSQISGGKECKEPETVVPPPGKIEFLSVKPNSVVLSWGCPEGLEGPKRFRVMWSSLTEMEGCFVIKELLKIGINNLKLGQKYVFSVATENEDGCISEWVTASVFTAVPAPRNLTKGHSEARAVSLNWTNGDNMEGIPHHFLITIESQGIEPQAIHTKDCYMLFHDLKPDTEYKISVSTVLNGQCSEKVSTNIHAEPCFREVLSKIGLEDQYDNKLTLSTVLEINQNDISEKKLETAKALPESFLKKLMMLNTNARSVKCVSSNADTVKNDAVNPLDLITALFLCSDGFLQQNIVVKMTLCQFAIPFLLPDHETREITLMLWSMREIVRPVRPSNQVFRKLSCEERLVLSDIPMVSFVRLGKMSLSKSEMLNKLLSNTKEYHNIFYHRSMVCGDVPRRISDGLVEISWYLPCGNRNIDKFTDPLAVANLRGDIRAFDKQFSFLCQTSTAVYIFCDKSEADFFKNLEGKDVKAEVILISSVQGKTFTLKTMMMKPSLKTTNVSQKKKTEAELIRALQESISKMLKNCPNKESVVNLADNARCCGILVDEDSDECQSALRNVSKITKHVSSISKFKEKQLPSQGHTKKHLRGKQQRFQMTSTMLSFLHGVVTSEVQRYYFLKWLEFDLDDLSRHQLSALRDRYKELSEKFPQNSEKIEEIDKQISVCSLRLEHFFRECGQQYECACHLPEYSHQRNTMEQLPALCAPMLLEGFPLELVDGDAANIPMKWITEVLKKLHSTMDSNSKLKVITIIGPENSGKSTLLQSMFGLRFAASKGTCTRGAFIQLISVNSDVREELGCDCIMIIDTEGLKPHHMVQDDHSHERDKEVASLAVALSDVTIINISGDNSREKEILEMVLQAFMRLKDVGKKPLCHFVHTNTSDKPAGERKKSGKELVEQLNEMIRTDTRMKKVNITKLSDVMEFEAETCSWYVPPVWHGTPPMAPVSVDYSETVHALKTRLLRDLRKCQERGDLTQFISTIERFWKGI